MKIELKNVKFSEHLSEETNAFTANLYVNGKKCGYVRNDGCGGDTMVQNYDGTTRNLFHECEEYCKTLPPRTYKFNGKTHEYPANIENFVDDLFEDWLKQKELKKLEKKMVDSLLWGVPNGSSYHQIKFKIPLTQIDRVKLQGYINKYKGEFKENEIFLNTNLQGFDL